MSKKLSSEQLAALEQFKNGKLDQASLLTLLATTRKPFTVDAVTWERAAFCRFNFDSTKKPSKWNGKTIKVDLVRDILKHAEEVSKACDAAEKMLAEEKKS